MMLLTALPVKTDLLTRLLSHISVGDFVNHQTVTGRPDEGGAGRDGESVEGPRPRSVLFSSLSYSLKRKCKLMASQGCFTKSTTKVTANSNNCTQICDNSDITHPLG